MTWESLPPGCLSTSRRRDVLRQLAERAGAGSSTLKELTVRLGEKVSRLKLRHGTSDRLGIFEGLEFLDLGIHGKFELWRTLGAVVADTRTGY